MNEKIKLKAISDKILISESMLKIEPIHLLNSLPVWYKFLIEKNKQLELQNANLIVHGSYADTNVLFLCI